jgi:hypothetical protein
MTPEQAESFRYNILDLTKVWPHKEFPLREIGKLVLDQNPQNYFAEIEQVLLDLQTIYLGFSFISLPRLGSHLLTSYPTSKPLRTPSFNLVSSHIRTLTATASVRTISSSPSTNPSHPLPISNVMAPLLI